MKPLEWTQWAAGGFIANMNDLLEYSIAKGVVHWRAYVGKHGYLGSFDSEHAAKAAAQADYEQRIRSALTAAPFNPVVSDDLVERAAKAIAESRWAEGSDFIKAVHIANTWPNHLEDARAALSVTPQIGSDKP